jgi:hypothetical protein
MQVNIKLVILELVAGIFGWVWIIAGLAALYFLVMAIVANGPWSRCLWAIGVSGVGKWLLRGFEDNKRRVAFEADLISQGYTPAEAAREWVARYTGQNNT